MRLWCQRGFIYLLLISVGLVANLHLPLVQAIAWSRMYAHYREDFSPEKALGITFSGQYPCKLCKLVQSAEKERGNMAGTMTANYRVLLPFQLTAAVKISPPDARSWGLSEPPARIVSRTARPELPPPRWV